MNLNILATKQEVATVFSEYFAELVATNETLHIALSGGSTPKIVFDHLAETYTTAIDWSKVHLYWGDERCVPPEDDESNYKMTVTHLLQKVNIPEENIHRILGEENPTTEAIRYGKVLGSQLPLVANVPQFDLVILGMGDDGHTASIFPHEITLWDADDNCVVATHPDSGQQRVSITGKVINAAKEVAFLVTGTGKAPKVKAIVELGNETYPAALVAPISGQLHWFLDRDAASEIIS